MSDAVWVAAITAVAGVLGGLVGALASPLGKDWVSRREFERTTAREDEMRQRQAVDRASERQREQAARQAEERRKAVTETLRLMSEAMHHYDLAWRGKAAYHADAEALKASAAAWTASRSVDDTDARDLVGAWWRALDGADMEYRGGSEPRGKNELVQSHRNAAEHLAALARDENKPHDHQ